MALVNWVIEELKSSGSASKMALGSFSVDSAVLTSWVLSAARSPNWIWANKFETLSKFRSNN